MPLGTLDGTPPPFFRQGPSALSKLMFFSALALFLMVADTRLKIAQPLRVALATVLYPVQWTVMQPVMWAQSGGQYFGSLQQAQANAETAQRQLSLQSQRANQVEQLALENERLRQLLGLRERLSTPAQAAQVLGVAEADVLAEIQAGNLKARQIGSQWRIAQAALDEFLRG